VPYLARLDHVEQQRALMARAVMRPRAWSVITIGFPNRLLNIAVHPIMRPAVFHTTREFVLETNTPEANPHAVSSHIVATEM